MVEIVTQTLKDNLETSLNSKKVPEPHLVRLIIFGTELSYKYV